MKVLIFLIHNIWPIFRGNFVAYFMFCDSNKKVIKMHICIYAFICHHIYLNALLMHVIID